MRFIIAVFIFFCLSSNASAQTLVIDNAIPSTVAKLLRQVFTDLKVKGFNEFSTLAKIAFYPDDRGQGVAIITYSFPISGIDIYFDDSMGVMVSPLARLDKLSYNLELLILIAQTRAWTNGTGNERQYLTRLIAGMRLRNAKLKTSMLFVMQCKADDVKLEGNVFYEGSGDLFELVGQFRNVSMRFENPLSNPYVTKALALLGYSKR